MVGKEKDKESIDLKHFVAEAKNILSAITFKNVPHYLLPDENRKMVTQKQNA